MVSFLQISVNIAELGKKLWTFEFVHFLSKDKCNMLTSQETPFTKDC